MTTYYDLYDLLNSANENVRLNFYKNLEAEVTQRIESRIYDEYEVDGMIHDLIKFSEDLGCEGHCAYVDSDHYSDQD